MTPQGVEHIEKGSRAGVVAAPPNSVTPQGVEHLAYTDCTALLARHRRIQ